MNYFTEYWYVWIAFVIMCIFLFSFYGKKYKQVKERRKNLNAMYFINCSTSSIKFTRRSQYLSNVKINLLFRWFTRNIQKVND